MGQILIEANNNRYCSNPYISICVWIFLRQRELHVSKREGWRPIDDIQI